MEYNFTELEKKWQKYWKENNTFKTENNSPKPKFYSLDMFPYPSGAGLHVGHPLGYIASDIYARYKRLLGFNVLHPMGYDSFGLPAEQYAIQTGQHPEITTVTNINRYREQLDKMGFSFDWDREVRTSDPKYYKWTQWIFIQLYKSWYNPETNKAESIDTLVDFFEKNGSACDTNQVLTGNIEKTCVPFTAADWKNYAEKQKQEILMNFRLAYLSEAQVNWCPAMGTVLANDEVKDGVSERGGHPVERKLMKQWSLRITAYADRLLEGLEKLDWTDSIKEAQRNWIGKSEGASLHFQLKNHTETIEVFTTRPDTIFGVSFVTLAPEHELVDKITTTEYKGKVSEYIDYTKKRSDRERQAEVKKITGQFTGAYVTNPFSGEEIPVWIGDYVLVGYGTGAVMGVPAHDSRDHGFAQHFGLPIKQVVETSTTLSAVQAWDFNEKSYDAKEGKIINSDFLNGLEVKKAITRAIDEAEKRNVGTRKVNYKQRDAVFGRQRYWGEPIPVYYKEGIPYVLDESELPLELPKVDKYLPTETGEPPLARAENWKYRPFEAAQGYEYEHTTMPGWAGSSWYFLRYMDAQNPTGIASKEALNYWKEVDLYIGGAEHSTGHLLYVRFWTKFLYDLGIIPVDEPAKKLINQGMILGRSSFVYRVKGENKFVSFGLKDQFETVALHADISLVNNDILDIEAFKKWKPEFSDAEFILEEGKYMCGFEIEKMSKSKHNVQTPDELVEKFGADTLRCYEMFLGPLEQSKPWDVKGINGVHNFLRKLWRLFYASGSFQVGETVITKDNLKTLHKTIKKITEDLERYSFNTPISTFMIAVNELSEQKCNNKTVLEPLLIILSPFAPHICEELWAQLGHSGSIMSQAWPKFDESHLKEQSFAYPISFNGKIKFKIELALDLSIDQIKSEVLSKDQTLKFLEGKEPKKIIIVPNKIVNIVI